ncbi:MAG: hypothetical protein KDI01_11890 [Halioglobus sp.]|nr:hypothetical protein [Halioglobus sp.]
MWKTAGQYGRERQYQITSNAEISTQTGLIIDRITGNKTSTASTSPIASQARRRIGR